MSTVALDGLVERLTREFQGEARGERIAALLGEYAGRHADWREFALFAPESYTRNLVSRNERFELLLLCWGPGHASPIHNHESQHCWMVVLDGDVEEMGFCTPAGMRPGPLAANGSRTFSRGQVAFIRDDIGLHVVRSGNTEQRAVSLHLYARPFDACNCYCPETGEITRKQLTNHSVRGELVIRRPSPAAC